MVSNTGASLLSRPLTGAERVCRVLLLLTQDGPTVEATGDKLAALAHFNRQDTYRELARLQREGVIERHGTARLTVVKRDALSEA